MSIAEKITKIAENEKKVYDAGKIAENGYYYRDMYFEAIATNGLNKAVRNNALDKANRGTYDKRRFD